MTRQALVATGLVASFALWGMLEALADNRFTKLGGTLSFLHAVLISGVIFWWATLDSEDRDDHLSDGWKAALVLLGIASMPFYLHKYRPATRRWVSIAKGFGLFVAALGLYSLAYLLTGAYDAWDAASRHPLTQALGLC